MRILLTGDWQAEWQNLDLCAKAAAEVEALLREHSLDGVCFLGDLKRHYNPVDMRVVKFWLRLIERIRKMYGVWVLEGNHDREGQYDDKQNWLEVLAKAGADVYDEPAAVTVGDGKLFLLPYRTKIKEARLALKQWSRQRSNPSRDVLVFHQDVNNARYNKLGARSDAPLTVEDFHSSNYLGCFGGHIHLHQTVGEGVHYVGSPFATDWGEANQRKGYVIITGSKFRFVESKIPRIFDEEWPGFRSDEVRAGSRLRIYVDIETGSSGDYGTVVERARDKASKRFPGAHIHVVPRFTDKQCADVKIRIHDPDQVKIKAYVRDTIPEFLEADERRIASYLTRKLESASGKAMRSSHGIRLIKAEAVNFLSFKNVECDFRKKGITLVDGINHDRPGSSNGAGKTSFLQLLPVALFGSTFKGQKHDRWARRGSEGGAKVSLLFQDSRGRMVRVTRERRPSALRLVVDKIEQSTGLRSDARDATQGLVEQLSGYTWQTLANAVYIDQSVARAFLSSRRSERSAILSKFQNLERFEAALALVKKDRNLNEENQDVVSSNIGDIDARIEETEDYIASTREQLLDQIRRSKQRVKELGTNWRQQSAKFAAVYEKAVAKAEKLASDVTDFEEVINRIRPDLDKATTLYNSFSAALESIESVEDESHCPTCYQVIKKSAVSKMKKDLQAGVNKAAAKKLKLQREVSGLESKVEDLENKFQEVQSAAEEAKRQRAQAEVFYKREQAREQENQAPVRATKRVLKEYKRKLQQFRERRALLAKSLKAHKQADKFYEYCVEAFSRDGIPAFLSRQLVPVLNREADYYSELFCDRAVQVRFGVREGEFDVETINATGGEGTDSQSTGEQAIAGLITAFSLRRVAPRCNVLVLDEPGAGLDTASTRQFAQGLKQLCKQDDVVFVTTHNPSLVAELGRERSVTIEKRRGISRCV